MTERRTDTRIPLLNEYIKISQKYEKVCVLEVKNHISEQYISKLVDEIKALNYIDNVIFISFDYENCVNLRKLLPNSTIQYITSEIGDITQLIQKLLKYNLDLDIHYNALNADIDSNSWFNFVSNILNYSSFSQT